MPSPKKRIIIDTNLWISFLLTKNFSIFSAAAEGGFDIISSRELMDELQRVAVRPKFRKHFTFERVEQLLFQISAIVISVESGSTVSVCRDPKDNFLLALALDSKATYLITGDKDLLVLKRFGETEILTLTEYLSIEKGR
jgi:putative PIN family toxin of toxin-antitoxin system